MFEKIPIIPIEEEVYAVDKPAGVSSNFFIQKIKRHYGFMKIGHSGTLDPFATGILILGVNKGTKKLSQYIGLNKTYLVTILLGRSTNTGDPTGETTQEILIDTQKEEYIRKNITDIVDSLVGQHSLPTPSFSAKKISGKKLYELARKGKPVPVVYHIATLYSVSKPIVEKNEQGFFVTFECTVSSGTYIRSIAVDIGNKLSVPAHVHSLRRTAVASFSM